MQSRSIAYNVTNTPLFGVVPITGMNLPRVFEFGFRYAFWLALAYTPA